MGPTRVAALTHAIAYRDETDADIPFVRDLYASTRAAELAPVPWPDAAKRAFLDDQFDKQRAWYRANYDGHWLIVERHGVAIGRLYLRYTPHRHDIVDIALVDEMRGQGIGGAIIADVLRDAAAAGAAVQVHVESNNPAHRLYTRLGFTVIDRGSVYDRMIWQPAVS